MDQHQAIQSMLFVPRSATKDRKITQYPVSLGNKLDQQASRKEESAVFVEAHNKNSHFESMCKTQEHSRQLTDISANENGGDPGDTDGAFVVASLTPRTTRPFFANFTTGSNTDF